MIEFKLSNNKHGWRHPFIGENKTVIWGFKSRRKALEKFEGNRLGMRRSLSLSNGERRYFWRRGIDYDTVKVFLSSCLGLPLEEVQKKFFERLGRNAGKLMESPLGLIKYFVGLGDKNNFCSRYYKRYSGDELVSFLGFYIDGEGLLREKRSVVYEKRSHFKPRMVPKRFAEFNKKNLHWPAEDPGIKPYKVGEGYVIMMEGNRFCPEPVPIWLILGTRYDNSREDGIKDRILSDRFVRVHVVGFPNEWAAEKVLYYYGIKRNRDQD